MNAAACLSKYAISFFLANITLGWASNRLDYIDREDVFGDWKLNGVPRAGALNLFLVSMACVPGYCIC